jgi:hypothetical protein
MRVSSCLRNGLPSPGFLNFFGRCPGHREPTSKCVPVTVPDVPLNLCLFQARHEPGPRIKPALVPFAGEDRIRRLELCGTNRRERLHGSLIQVDRPWITALCLPQLNTASADAQGSGQLNERIGLIASTEDSKTRPSDNCLKRQYSLAPERLHGINAHSNSGRYQGGEPCHSTE